MAAVPYYPEQVPWTDKKDWISPEQPGDLVESDHVNQLYAEVNAIGQDVVSHKADEMPHIFKDGIKTYKWGLKVISGVVTMVYEEVT